MNLFDQTFDRRNSNSTKWDKAETLFAENVLPMWVADMDYPSPQPVIDALRERVQTGFFGYHFPPESLYQAIIEKMASQYDWKVEKEWIVFSPGVINAIQAALGILTIPGDEVIVQPPVYYPFFGAIASKGCRRLDNPLKRKETHYEMDFDQLRTLFEPSFQFPARDPRIRALILCSPHNPVGRVWTSKELASLAEICLDHDCALISDEIHCDLMVGQRRHQVLAQLAPEIEAKTITLMSTSKTFNTPGLNASFVIIPNASWRQRFIQAAKVQGGVNVLGLTAMEAALSEGAHYLNQLLDHLKRNIAEFAKGIEECPNLQLIPPEGTYLAWVDMRQLQLDDRQLKDFMLHDARIATDYGYVFGPGGEGFQRFNLATSRSIIDEAVRRLKSAAEKRDSFGSRIGRLRK